MLEFFYFMLLLEKLNVEWKNNRYFWSENMSTFPYILDTAQNISNVII